MGWNDHADPVLCPECCYAYLLPGERLCTACWAAEEEYERRGERRPLAGKRTIKLTKKMQEQINQALNAKEGPWTQT